MDKDFGCLFRDIRGSLSKGMNTKLFAEKEGVEKISFHKHIIQNKMNIGGNLCENGSVKLWFCFC